MVISVRSRLEERNDSISNVRTDGRWPWYILNYYCVVCGWYLKSSTWLCRNGMGWCIPFSFDWYHAHQLVIVHSCSTWIWVLDNCSVHRANFRVPDDCSGQHTASTMLRFEWIQLLYSNYIMRLMLLWSLSNSEVWSDFYPNIPRSSTRCGIATSSFCLLKSCGSERL